MPRQSLRVPVLVPIRRAAEQLLHMLRQPGSSRRCTLSRAGAASAGRRRGRGRSAAARGGPAAIFAIGSPSQRMIPSLARTNPSSTASFTRAARPSISLASAFLRPRRSALWRPRPTACGSAVKRNPLSWPTCCPSTITSRLWSLPLPAWRSLSSGASVRSPCGQRTFGRDARATRSDNVPLPDARSPAMLRIAQPA